jgi:hypothetical protein
MFLCSVAGYTEKIRKRRVSMLAWGLSRYRRKATILCEDIPVSGQWYASLYDSLLLAIEGAVCAGD